MKPIMRELLGYLDADTWHTVLMLHPRDAADVLNEYEDETGYGLRDNVIQAVERVPEDNRDKNEKLFLKEVER